MRNRYIPSINQSLWTIKHPHIICCQGAHQVLQSRRSFPRSICHMCARSHLKDLLDGWGGYSHLPNRGRIHSSHQKAHQRVQTTISPIIPSDSGPQDGSINGTEAGLYHMKPQGTGNKRPVNHIIILPIEKWGIHKTLEGETKWKISESNKDTKVHSSRCGILGKWENSF